MTFLKRKKGNDRTWEEEESSLEEEKCRKRRVE